ncbi:DNA sulfur modification protein DndB [Vibrio lentus]
MTNEKKLILPCLRGYMGSWTTYSCMMRLSDVAHLIGFANELHTVTKLSDMIQREVKSDRADEIAEYLEINEDRFFNSLVVAIHGGNPNWHDIGNVTPNSEEMSQLEFPEYAQNSLGFLSLTKAEKFFALDGQHRLAGIKKAVRNNSELRDELLNVIVITHTETAAGIVRSRKLFTTLNKKAEPVSKGDIIALDEDDIAACITRRLIEDDNFAYFTEDNISFSTGAVRDTNSITSIVNIYDNVQKIVAYFLNVKVKELDKYKFTEHKDVLPFVYDFFGLTFENNLILKQVALQRLTPGDLRKTQTGGNMLLRPIGWDIYTDIVIKGLNSKMELDDVIKQIHNKDLELGGDILSGQLWSNQQKKILKTSANKIKSLTNRLLN